jgi:hypothetical protein
MHAHLPSPHPDRPIHEAAEASGIPNSAIRIAPTPLVQILPWDFRTSFPEPLEEAIEAGKLNEDDAVPENLKALHEEHAQHLLTLLSDLDALLDARRRGVDPQTGRVPRTPKQKERLESTFRTEPGRLEREFDVLMDVYEEAFGAGAADAFRKAVRAWHAGMEVITENAPVLPPLTDAINIGAFGMEEDGNAIHPAAEEIEEITEQLADELLQLTDGPEREALLSKYAQDFGETAARELDRWSLLKPQTGGVDDHGYDPAHPWHYYHEGEGAEPMPLDQIPARPVTLEQFGVNWPKGLVKQRATMERVLASQRKQLEEDEQRYEELVQNGVEALSRYDREIAYAGNDDLAWASAIALKFAHISGGRGRIACLERRLRLPVKH